MFIAYSLLDTGDFFLVAFFMVASSWHCQNLSLLNRTQGKVGHRAGKVARLQMPRFFGQRQLR